MCAMCGWMVIGWDMAGKKMHIQLESALTQPPVVAHSAMQCCLMLSYNNGEFSFLFQSNGCTEYKAKQ